jgi:hypothetical protein
MESEMTKRKVPPQKKLSKISREEAIIQGLERYFSGEPCKYGHIAEREVERGLCVECRVDIAQTRETTKERRTLSCKNVERYLSRNATIRYFAHLNVG